MSKRTRNKAEPAPHVTWKPEWTVPVSPSPFETEVVPLPFVAEVRKALTEFYAKPPRKAPKDWQAPSKEEIVERVRRQIFVLFPGLRKNGQVAA